MLSKHVVANYAEFVKGIDDVAALESELENTHEKVKNVRFCLGSTKEDVHISLKIGSDSRARQHIGDVLETAEKLLQTRNLQQSLQ